MHVKISSLSLPPLLSEIGTLARPHARQDAYAESGELEDDGFGGLREEEDGGGLGDEGGQGGKQRRRNLLRDGGGGSGGGAAGSSSSSSTSSNFVLDHLHSLSTLESAQESLELVRAGAVTQRQAQKQIRELEHQRKLINQASTAAEYAKHFFNKRAK